MADVYEDASGKPISTIDLSNYEDYQGKPLSQKQPQLRVKDPNQSMDIPNRQYPIDPRLSTNPNDMVVKSLSRQIPSLLGILGSYEGPIGGAAGSAAGEGLRNLSPEYFGGDESGNVGQDLLYNSALPAGLNQFARVLTKGPRGAIADLLASKMGQKVPAVKNLMQATEDFQNTTHQAFSDATDKASQAYQDAAKQAELEYRQKIFGKNNPMVKDPNVPTPSGFKLPDPVNFQPRSSDLPQNYSGFTNAEPDLEQVKGIIQKAQEGAKDIKNPLIRYARNSLMFRLGAMAGVGGLSPTAAAVGSTLVLGNAAIKQLASNPETAQLIIKAINTPGDDEQSAFVGKTLMNALRGIAVTVKNADGDTQPAIINDKGQLVYKK